MGSNSSPEDAPRRLNRWKLVSLLLLLLLVVCSLVLVSACCCHGGGSVAEMQPLPMPPIGLAHLEVPEEVVPAAATQTQMRNVMFRITPQIGLHIHEMRGEMAAKEEGRPLNFDNPESFVMRILDARIGLSAQSLTTLMNDVFSYPEAPLRDLQVTISGQYLRQEGILHKVIDIPFTMLADVTATEDGRIRLHPVQMEICNLPGQPLMKAFGMTLEEILDLSEARGVAVEGNDLLIDPVAVLPSPAIEGRLTEVRIEGDEMLQVFSSGANPPALVIPVEANNYMFFEEGTLRMGKLFMVRGDMLVADLDESDPFDFFLNQYNKQLVAGYNENLADYGLLVFMRDFSDLGTPLKPGEVPPFPRSPYR